MALFFCSVSCASLKEVINQHSHEFRLQRSLVKWKNVGFFSPFYPLHYRLIYKENFNNNWLKTCNDPMWKLHEKVHLEVSTQCTCSEITGLFLPEHSETRFHFAAVWSHTELFYRLLSFCLGYFLLFPHPGSVLSHVDLAQINLVRFGSWFNFAHFLAQLCLSLRTKFFIS